MPFNWKKGKKSAMIEAMTGGCLGASLRISAFQLHKIGYSGYNEAR
jgi:hypothetical protein